jgi:hypothetical protein
MVHIKDPTAGKANIGSHAINAPPSPNLAPLERFSVRGQGVG